jgi:hypothetical protein
MQLSVEARCLLSIALPRAARNSSSVNLTSPSDGPSAMISFGFGRSAETIERVEEPVSFGQVLNDVEVCVREMGIVECHLVFQ